jgi:putative lipase involved disintegration of autophagic bodies
VAVCQFLSERYTDALIALEGHCLRGDIDVLLGDTDNALPPNET